MINDRIAKACTETLAVLNNVPENEYYKIPKEFILMLLENSDNTYQFMLDSTKNFQEQELLMETIDILAYIYRKFWCSNEEKEEFDRILLQNEEKYNPDNIFNNRNRITKKEEDNDNNEVSITIYKEPIFIKIKRWLKEMFLKHM